MKKMIMWCVLLWSSQVCLALEPYVQGDKLAGADLSAHGNVVDHEYEIERDGATVATVSKKWFRVRDSYGVEVAPGEDAGLMLAITVCMDELSR